MAHFRQPTQLLSAAASAILKISYALKLTWENRQTQAKHHAMIKTEIDVNFANLYWISDSREFSNRL